MQDPAHCHIVAAEPGLLQLRSEAGGLVQESWLQERRAVLPAEACLSNDGNSKSATEFGSMGGFHDHADNGSLDRAKSAVTLPFSSQQLPEPVPAEFLSVILPERKP